MAVPRLLFAAPILIVVGGMFAPGLTSATPLPKGSNVVGMVQVDYDRNSITLHTGDRLELVNNSNFLHVVTLGRNGSIEREPGAPRMGGSRGLVPMPRGTVYVTRPWNIPGTYHLTCTLHTGMNLTVVVVGDPASGRPPGPRRLVVWPGPSPAIRLATAARFTLCG
jgi:plastocyanin